MRPTCDPEHMVRITAVRDMPPELLPLVRHDPDPEVRVWVARRIDARARADVRRVRDRAAGLVDRPGGPREGGGGHDA